MRIGIVSDIHTDVVALERALEEMRPVDHVLCAGDMVIQYRFSNEVFDIIRTRGITAVKGNHEEAILSSAGSRMRASGTISPKNLNFLEFLPSVLEMVIDGKRIIMRHTSPLDPTGGGRELRTEPEGEYYLAEPSADFDPDTDLDQEIGLEFGPLSISNGATIHLAHRPKEFSESDADVLIVGHTHRSVVARVGKTLVINPGSIGQPRDPNHPHRRTYAILDTSTWQATIGAFEQLRR